MSVAALLAATVFQFGMGHDGVVVDGGLVYRDASHGRSVIRRLDLETGARTLLYAAPHRRTPIVDMEAGGGTIVFQLAGAVKRVYRMGARGAGLKQLFGVRDHGARCGRVIRLRDVSTGGELLYEDVTVSCRTHMGRYRLRTLDPENRARVLRTHRMDDLFLTDGPPFHQLAGEQLVTWGDRIVRVRDLTSGRVRRFRRASRLSSFSEPDVAADGRVLLDEFRYMGRGRFPLQTIRLVDAAGGSTVVHRRQGIYGAARFCGDHAVVYTFSRRRRLRLRVVDPPLEPRLGDSYATCDGRHFVLATVGEDDGDRAYVYALPQ
jgi:hypothetical protein